ncbi:hypothetical protein M5K25_004405 [Dendrobium thyrsiflorum]|uniref:Uncharacterized protein n=1 Tax=Dendrobium thyrsiflorum TaxID=117978 RepID=A0ABD0VM72_DENTH
MALRLQLILEFRLFLIQTPILTLARKFQLWRSSRIMLLGLEAADQHSMVRKRGRSLLSD